MTSSHACGRNCSPRTVMHDMAVFEVPLQCSNGISLCKMSAVRNCLIFCVNHAIEYTLLCRTDVCLYYCIIDVFHAVSKQQAYNSLVVYLKF